MTNSIFPISARVPPSQLQSTTNFPFTGGLDQEDVSIYSEDTHRWHMGGYWLHQDEAPIFVTMLNAISDYLSLDILFALLPQCQGVVDALVNLRWDAGSPEELEASIPHDCDAVRALLGRSDGMPYKQMVFLHLENEHWHLIHHMITSEHGARVYALNTLPLPSNVNLSSQITYQEFFRNPRPAAPPAHMPPYVYPTSYPVLQQAGAESCGFWAIFFAFLILLDFDLASERVITLSETSLKERLAAVWRSFISDDIGLRGHAVKSSFDDFLPMQMFLIDHDHTIPRPPSMESCKVFSAAGNCQAATVHTATSAPQEDQAIFEARHTIMDGSGLPIGDASCLPRSFEQLLKDEPVNNEVINSTLFLLQHTEAMLLHTSITQLEFWVISTFLSKEMATTQIDSMGRLMPARPRASPEAQPTPLTFGPCFE
ncbi:hypothetical protein BOTBODRAFT_173288 [Botryobasidium botryosum FD-172 SS1]|uniref:Ubiquitin-like protease family profile domain-containing protein n=1 Tax=Botryobasidium botryosum (strain FD-172 SS1) TaxID=930990 RepID=A0A067MJQ0_BOTB1|nr:hypothetical protein BOTBODRAFT_173288 [Botryobasidium botryosum FD-172 SS1]